MTRWLPAGVTLIAVLLTGCSDASAPSPEAVPATTTAPPESVFASVTGDRYTTPSESIFASVSVGRDHACGLWPNGTVECWGRNNDGQAQPPGGRFASISAGSDHTCGVRASGTVECWGDWLFGKATPPGDEFLSGYGGDEYVCGVTHDDWAVCWGSNGDWRGKTIAEAQPPFWKFASVSLGSDHTCGVMTEGRIVCWGDNSERQSAPPSGEFLLVSARSDRTCGLRIDGTVVCWGGESGSGSLADLDSMFDSIAGHSGPTTVPVPHPGGVFASISVGNDHTCGVRASGAVECWGENNSGEADPPGGKFLSVSSGSYHTCGVKTDGSIACWGSNRSYKDENTGQADPPGGEFSSVSSGDYSTCGLRTDGTVMCWGYEFDDQHYVGRNPGVPENPRYRWDNSKVVVSWDASIDADFYNIYYDNYGKSCGIDDDGPVFCDELATNIPVNSYVHTNPVKDEDANHYWIAACNSHGCSHIDSDNRAEYIDTSPE